MTYQTLSGLRIVESSAFIAAPLAGLTFAQMGADVIRIDMPGGGIDYGRMPRMPSGRSLYWTGLNKGKRSAAIDLRKDEGRELAQQLICAPGPDAGILLTNIGVPWLSHTVLEARRSDIISCTIEGSSDGSTAVDYTVNCATGIPAITGGGHIHRPVNHVLPAWDLACAYQAAFAMMAAIDGRRRRGHGAQLRMALSDVAFSALSHLGMLAEAELLDEERPSIGNHLYGAFGRDFATADGSRIMVAAISQNQWKALIKACEADADLQALAARMGVDFNDEAQRYEAREEIAGILEPWFAVRTDADVTARLQEHRVCWGRYQTLKELLAHDVRIGVGNPVFSYVDTPGVGRHLAAGPVVRIGDAERGGIAPAPLVGQHTDEVLHEILGLDSSAIGLLHDRGIVAGPGGR